MLLAEIHGKRCPAAEASEDFLTSAVFGQLRYVRQGDFWARLFGKALAVRGERVSLLQRLIAEGVGFEGDCDVKVRFWPRIGNYEPDLLMLLRNQSCRPVILVIEVKLNSPKNTCRSGEDQLCRYLKILDDRSALSAVFGESVTNVVTALVYLTLSYAGKEVMESIDLAPVGYDAAKRMFPLQWQDITEAIQEMSPPRESILDEVFRFLCRREYIHFRGFHEIVGFSLPATGHFYESTYFAPFALDLMSMHHVSGGFYAE